MHELFTFNLVPCNTNIYCTLRSLATGSFLIPFSQHYLYISMPVAHLGLTVSHIPSATSFYLQALQPLGYHYIGQSGDSIGLGVHEADLFLTQEPNG